MASQAHWSHHLLPALLDGVPKKSQRQCITTGSLPFALSLRRWLVCRAGALSLACGGIRPLKFKGAQKKMPADHEQNSATELFCYFRRNAVTLSTDVCTHIHTRKKRRPPGQMRAAQDWDAVWKSMESVLEQEAKERALNRDAIATLRRCGERWQHSGSTARENMGAPLMLPKHLFRCPWRYNDQWGPAAAPRGVGEDERHFITNTYSSSHTDTHKFPSYRIQ